MRFQLQLLLACSCLLTACVKDKPPVSSTTATVSIGKQQVFVINEGNYGSANAMLGSWDSDKKTYVQDLYKEVNANGCGDVLQSMSKQANTYYLLVNNSGKILVCDAGLKKTAEISGVTSPRYMQVVSPAKAYVSDLYANAISVVDLTGNRVSAKIPCKGWTEHMAMVYNKVFVTNVNSNYVYVLNSINDRIEDSVLVGENAAGIALDKQAMVWVLLRGKTNANHSKLVCINAADNSIKKEIDVAGTAFDLQSNADGSFLYFINGGIQSLDITTTQIKQVVTGHGTYYGLGVEPISGNLYLADAKDYTQRSEVTVYSANGDLVTNFLAGINCNGFYFK